MAKTRIRLDGQTDNDLVDMSGNAVLDGTGADLSSYGVGGLEGHLLRADGKIQLSAEIAAIESGHDKSVTTKEWQVSKLDALDVKIEDNSADISAQGASLTALISAEETRALSAESALQASIDAEATAARAAEAGIQAALDTQEAKEAAYEVSNDAALAAEIARATAAEAALQADVNLNEADGDTDRALIRTEMAANETARDASVEAIRAALQADVDLNEADGDTDRALIRSEIAAAKLVDDAALATEAARALAAEAAIQSDVDQNELDGDNDRAAIRSEIAAAKLVDDAAMAAEIARASAAEAAIQADVDQNESDADAAIAALQADVDQNEADADAAEAALQVELDATQAGAGLAASGAYVAVGARNFIGAASSLDDADAKLDTALKAEETRASAAEAAIQADVDQNESDADAAMAAEQTARASGDAAERAFALSARTANESARDSSIAGAKVTHDQEVAAAKAAADAALAAEAARALAAEAVIQADVDLNEADGDADRALIRTEMAANETNRDASEAAAIQTAVNSLIDAAPATLDTLNELAAAMADDPDFHASMATIHAAATTDRALIRTEALTEKGLKDVAIAALQADVDLNEADGDTDRALIRSEIAAAKLVDDAALAAEIARASAAEVALQADVDQNEADGDADRAAIRSEIAAAKLVDDAAMAAEVARASAAEAANEVHIDNLATLSGVAKDSVNLGTFTGSAIADNGTVKAGLQALETALEVVVNGSAVTASTITATGDTTFENTGVHTFKGNTFFHTGTNHIGGATMHAEMNAMYGMKVGPGGTPVMTIDSSGNLDTDGTLDVAGAATLSSTLDVTGAADFDGGMDVTGDVQTHDKVSLAKPADNKPALRVGDFVAGDAWAYDGTTFDAVIKRGLQVGATAHLKNVAIPASFQLGFANGAYFTEYAKNHSGATNDHSPMLTHRGDITMEAAERSTGSLTMAGTLAAAGNISAPLFEGALQAASVQTHMSHTDAGLDSAPSSGAERVAELSYSAGVYSLKSATIDEIQAHAGAAIAAQEVLAAAARAVIQADVDANEAASDAAELALQNRATFLEGRVMKEYFVVAQNAETAFALSELAEHGSIMVFVNGLLQEVDYSYTDGQGNPATTVLDYTMSDNGTVSTVTFNVPGLIAGDRVSVKFDKRLV